MQPRVFIPQITERWDDEAERRVPIYDFTRAATFGALTSILDKDDRTLFPERIIPKVRAALADFNADTDYLVAVGDPSVIAICSGIILRRSKNMKMLRWDRRSSDYIVLDIDV